MDRLLDVLTGQLPLPPTKFVSYEGHINEDAWGRLLEALRHNKEAVGVRLRGCGLGCTQAGHLAEVMATNACLEVLELPDNNIGARGVQSLVDTLRLNNCTLKSIDLSGNPCYDDAAYEMLELDTLLKRNRVIKKLPKTPGGTGGGSRAPGVLSSKSTNCTPTVGLSTPQLPQSLFTATGMTPHGVPFELEQRLQHLEEAEATIRSELEHVRSFSSQSEVWQKKIDAAGQQIAAILSLVDSRNLTLEARLQTMEHWHTSAEQAWAGQSKVMEDMASQLLCLMRRVQTLEGQLGRADAAGSRESIAVSLRLSAAGAAEPPAPHIPNAATLWQEMVTLKERLAKLETCSREWDRSRSTAASDDKKASEEGQKQHGLKQRQGTVEDGNMAARKQPARSTGGADDTIEQVGPQQLHGAARLADGVIGATGGGLNPCKPQVTVGASLSEFSSLESLSPALVARNAGQDEAATTIRLSSSPLRGADYGRGGVHSDGGAVSRQPSCPQQQQQQALPIRVTESLQGRRGVGVQPLEMPNSPILWHVNSFAVSPGSCGITPTHEHAQLPVYLAEGDRAKPPPVDTALSSSKGSQCSGGSHNSQEDAQEDPTCSGFVMYAAAQRMRDGRAGAASSAAAQRYGPPQGPQAHDSVDFSAQLRSGKSAKPVDGKVQDSGDPDVLHGSPGQQASAATPELAGPAQGSPGTPRGSTFSVDAETVSLSVAMAGSAARPRAPAATTTSDTPPLATAATTKDPNDPEPAWAKARASGQKQGPQAEVASAEPSWTPPVAGSTHLVAHAHSAGISEAASVVACPIAEREVIGVDLDPRAADSVGTPDVSVRQWAGTTAVPPASAAATSTGSLTPTSRPRPTASTTPAGGAAPRPVQHLTSPLLSASARRGGLARASRSGLDIHRTSADAKAVPTSPAGCDGQGSTRRALHTTQHHQSQQHQLGGATTAEVSTAVRSSRQRDVTGHEQEHGRADSAVARSSSASCAATAPLQGFEDAAGMNPSEDPKANASGTHALLNRSNTIHAGTHPPQPAGAHVGAGASHLAGHPPVPGTWLPGRASVQSHSIRNLAARGCDSAAGASAKMAAAPHTSRVSSFSCMKPSNSNVQRTSSSTTSTTVSASATSAVTPSAPTRCASSAAAVPPSSAATAPVGTTHDTQPAEHGSGLTQQLAEPARAGRVAGHHHHPPAGGSAAGHYELRTPREGAREQAAACGTDAGEAAAHTQAAASAGDGAAAQPPHSSRGYRPGSITARTLTSGTAANIAGPLAKGGAARASIRNVTSVAGATAKRWM